MRSSSLPTLVLLILALAPFEAFAQCPNQPADGNLTTVDGSLLADGTCVIPGHPNPVITPDKSLTDGGWLKVGSTLIVHSKADTSGKCFKGVPSGNGCIFVDINDLRTVNKIVNRVQPHQWRPAQDMTATNFSIFARDSQGFTVFRQHVDTQVPNSTSGPLVQHPGPTIGTYDYSFWSIINTTNCFIEPGQSQTVTKSINVVACAPNFRDDNRHIPHDGQVVDISIPTGQGSPIDVAVNHATTGWTNAGLDMTFNRIYTTCVPVSNIHCIQINTTGVLLNPSACAGVGEVNLNPNTGEITQYLPIYLRPDAASWAQLYLDYVIAHELAHAMNLEHQNPRCTDIFGNGLSAMNYNSDVLGCNHMDNLPSAAQISDAMAIMSSVYNANPVPKKSCQ